MHPGRATELISDCGALFPRGFQLVAKSHAVASKNWNGLWFPVDIRTSRKHGGLQSVTTLRKFTIEVDPLKHNRRRFRDVPLSNIVCTMLCLGVEWFFSNMCV